jgi:CheY-like chemotaxis protein
LTYAYGQVTFALSPRIRGNSLARKILLADDSVTAQNMGRKILADAGYEVVAVNNGSAALKKISELKPDLVILDVYMPGYSGLEVCQRLKESQETARIPVLLTVGKLEPFKPEEAQRVRAEGFIVKPFEASELLSALSKLEDKVVPRSEPSKPGRFARAIAAAEESGRGGRSDADADTGWKSRIGFPKAKTEPEEKVADEAPIYNPVNRDLRTVVESSGEKPAEKKEETRQPAEKTVEKSLDVAALVPTGLPKDVTPEEVAAIAAAAAQMQMVASALKGEHQVSPAHDKDQGNVPSPPEFQRDPAAAVEMEAKTEAPAEKKEESKLESAPVEAAAPETYRRRKDDVRPEETQDVPVTMAATAESVVAASAGRPRWTAVSVALEGSESAISLDQEMQKAYAAVAAAGSAGVVTAPAPEPAPAGNSFARTQAEMESPAAISHPGPEPVRETVAAEVVPAETALAETVPSPVVQSEVVPEASISAPIIAEFAPVEAPPETSPAVAFAEPNQAPAPVAESASGTQESQPRQESESAIMEASTAASNSVTPNASRPEGAEEKPEPPAESKLDPEAVKNTAAAWATWRQTRDVSTPGEVAGEVRAGEVGEDQRRELNLPESAPLETAARAVAAGAEQIMQEAAATAPNGDAGNVASIVDSVLADLRPKLMEEISRKMSEKK